jgi:hypothetical protein
MKSEPSKSVTMKSNARATPYFSAYPLKALHLSPEKTGNNNKISTTRVIGRSRVLPMVNPYSEKTFSINKIKLPANVQSAEDNWFNNYE